MPVAAPVAVMDDILLPRFLQKGGAAGALLRAMDWTRHPLGPPETWPIILQTTVGIVLGSRQPMFVAWGQDYLTIYNDGFAQICPDRHPASLGGKLEDMWYDIWDKVGPMCESVFAGESIHLDDFQVLLHRNGRLEEAHFSFSYTPLQNERAEVLGLFCACAETTEQVFLRRELDHEMENVGSRSRDAASKPSSAEASSPEGPQQRLVRSSHCSTNPLSVPKSHETGTRRAALLIDNRSHREFQRLLNRRCRSAASA